MASYFLSMTSLAKFYPVTEIILEMWSCDQSLLTLAFLWEKLSQLELYKDLTRKTTFLRVCPGSSSIIWNRGLTLVMVLKFYTSVAKWLKIKVRKFWRLTSTNVEVTGGKLVGVFFATPSWIRLKFFNPINFFYCVGKHLMYWKNGDKQNDKGHLKKLGSFFEETFSLEECSLLIMPMIH